MNQDAAGRWIAPRCSSAYKATFRWIPDRLAWGQPRLDADRHGL